MAIYNVKFDPKRDAEAVRAIAESMGGIIVIKEFPEVVEIHTDQLFVREEMEEVREHFRKQKTG